jgi:hypothetical protein
MTSADLLPMIRELYSLLPETRRLLAWELQHVLFSLGYVDDLAGRGGDRRTSRWRGRTGRI